ncbi:MAG: ATP-binding protein, partial [Cyanobacteriota bacterium]
MEAVEQHSLKGDPSRLRQILTNLVSNAIKFAHHGKITVRASLTSVDDQLRLTASVIDTGIGIPPDKISSLFHTFTQMDASTTRQYGGTGLGLSIVKKLCELMGGTITVKSEVGQGSEFTFMIPFQVGKTIPLPLTPVYVSETSRQSEQVRLLIVEDNRVNQLVLQGILQKQGFQQLELASNGLEALKLLQKSGQDTPYTLILMDCLMPEIDGYQTTRRIRRGDAGAAYQNIPIIALTANAMESDRQKCLQAGMNDYLTKPIRPESLSKMLSQWLLPLPEIPEIQASQSKSLRIKDNPLPIFDSENLLKLFAGDQTEMLEFCQQVIEEIQQEIPALKEALRLGNLSEVVMKSHCLRGLAANARAVALSQVCDQFEKAARADSLTLNLIQSQITKFDQQFHQFQQAVKQWQQQYSQSKRV